MEQLLAREEANDKLRTFVGTFGLLQYPLVICLFIGALVAAAIAKRANLRLLYLPPLLVAVVCGAFMFYREYFTSLGW